MENFKLENKVILIISPEPWGDYFVSKHHYASVLSARNVVYFLNPPGAEFRKKLLGENLYSVDYKSTFKGIRYLPKSLSGYFIKKDIESLESKLESLFDIIWNFDPSRFFNLSQIKLKLKICHIVDLNQVYQRKTLAQTSDICFTVSENIKTILKGHNQSVHKINHGYQKQNESQNSTFIFPGNNELKAVLIGNLSRSSIDWGILHLTASENESVDFIFIGPEGKSNLGSASKQNEIKKIKELQNVYFTGAVKSFEIPDVLRKSDILMVSFKEEFHQDQTNSHKLMEYMGSGKTIVATKTKEYTEISKKGLIAMSNKNSDFVHLFSDVVEHLGTWNSDIKQKKRIAFANNNSYQKQIERVEKLICQTN